MGDIVEAVRIDRHSGAAERARLTPVGEGDSQVYVVSHEPPQPPTGAVLICSSVLVDLLANYLREVHLARRLAAAGVSTLRFHYRGTGNSDLDASEFSLSTLVEDAIWARDQLVAQTGGAPLAFVGTRWGALTALAAAEPHPTAPVVLVEPVVEIERYFREAMRAKRMTGIATGASVASSDVPAALAADGLVDVVGDVIHPRFYESVAHHDPLAGLVPGSRPVLLAQMGGRALRPGHRSLMDRLRSLGWSADSVIVDVDESWWFRTGPADALQTGLTEPVATWLTDQLGTVQR